MSAHAAPSHAPSHGHDAHAEPAHAEAGHDPHAEPAHAEKHGDGWIMKIINGTRNLVGSVINGVSHAIQLPGIAVEYFGKLLRLPGKGGSLVANEVKADPNFGYSFA